MIYMIQFVLDSSIDWRYLDLEHSEIKDFCAQYVKKGEEPAFKPIKDAYIESIALKILKKSKNTT